MQCRLVDFLLFVNVHRSIRSIPNSLNTKSIACCIGLKLLKSSMIKCINCFCCCAVSFVSVISFILFNWLLITDWFRLNWLISWSINLFNTSPERSSTVANVDKLWIDAFVSLRNVNVLAWEYKTPESETTNCCKCKSIRVCSLDWIVFCSCCLICLPCNDRNCWLRAGLTAVGWMDRSIGRWTSWMRQVWSWRW